MFCHILYIVFPRHTCIPIETCTAGHFYDQHTLHCTLCPMNTYQPELGKNYCIQCPALTYTDSTGAVSASQCKGNKAIIMQLYIPCSNRRSCSYRFNK